MSEVKYEYQWIIRYQTGAYAMTTYHYTSKDELEKSLARIKPRIMVDPVERYEPSRREVMEEDRDSRCI